MICTSPEEDTFSKFETYFCFDHINISVIVVFVPPVCPLVCWSMPEYLSEWVGTQLWCYDPWISHREPASSTWTCVHLRTYARWMWITVHHSSLSIGLLSCNDINGTYSCLWGEVAWSQQKWQKVLTVTSGEGGLGALVWTVWVEDGVLMMPESSCMVLSCTRMFDTWNGVDVALVKPTILPMSTSPAADLEMLLK
jgi:hypothetical protein